MSAFHLLTVVQDAITVEFAVRLSASVRRDENAAYRMRCFSAKLQRGRKIYIERLLRRILPVVEAL
jgi:Na+/H+-translocating membrane pyrophosphatase